MAKSVPFDKWPLHEKLARHLQVLMVNEPENLEHSANRVLQTVSMAGESAYPSERVAELASLEPLQIPLELFGEFNPAMETLLEPYRDLSNLDEPSLKKKLPDLEDFLNRIRES